MDNGFEFDGDDGDWTIEVKDLNMLFIDCRKNKNCGFRELKLL